MIAALVLAVKVAATQHYAALTWKAPVDRGSLVLTYDVFRGASCTGGGTRIGSVALTRFKDNTVTPGATYCYWVEANDGVDSGASNRVSVTVP